MTIGSSPLPLESPAASLVLPRMFAYLELTKPRVNLLVTLTAAAGFYMGSRGSVDLIALLQTVIGTGLIAAGSAALNQYMERGLDARMTRTAGRPLPSGRLTPAAALIFGLVLTILGAIYLAAFVNFLSSGLGLLTSFLYLLIYTPLKTRTPLCTAVGAVPGAIPPLIGWAAAANNLDLGAAGLFLILLLWQFPHFLAISWAYRRDYREGGFSMLSSVDPEGARTAWRILVYSAFLILVSFLPAVLSISGDLYLTGAALLGISLLAYGIQAARVRSRSAARQLSLATVVYLPVLLLLMVADKV